MFRLKIVIANTLRIAPLIVLLLVPVFAFGAYDKHADIPYAAIDGVDKNLLSMDIHSPKQSASCPVAVYIHGGYWQAGDKSQTGHLPELFCGRGFVFVSINYRLAPKVKHPVIIDDVAKALAFVHDNCGKYGGDRTRIHLLGHSAGAHLAALIGTDTKRLAALGMGQILRSVIPLDSAAMNISAVAANDRRPESPYRAAFGDDASGWDDASPTLHAARAPLLPPFFLVLAYGPSLESKRRWQMDFIHAVRSNKGYASLADASAFREHQSLMTEFGASNDTVAPAVIAFIEDVEGRRLSGSGTEQVLNHYGSAAAVAAERAAYNERVLMKQFDKNKDGAVTRDELSSYAGLFERLDADRNGTLSPAELSAYNKPAVNAVAVQGSAAIPKSVDTFSPNDERIGSIERAYVDPEILQHDGGIAYLDSALSLWIGRLDPHTGGFVPSEDVKIDSAISPWSRYANGPEWGMDRDGVSLFYIKDNKAGTGQLWRALPPWDAPRVLQMTHDTHIHNWVCEPSVDASSASTRIIIYRGAPKGASNANAWIDEDDPSRLNVFTEKMIVARFAPHSPLITFAYRALRGQKEPSQVMLVDTASGKIRAITADAGNKIDPWLWQSPEYGGEYLCAVNIDNESLGIYREIKKGDAWERIARMALPVDAPHTKLKSVEPVNGGRGAFGASYFTVQAGLDEDTDTSIWLFGYRTNGRHVIRRLDDGAVTARKERRLDPESYVGSNELFVYYTLTGRPSQLHRCRTGVTRQHVQRNEEGKSGP